MEVQTRWKNGNNINNRATAKEKKDKDKNEKRRKGEESGGRNNTDLHKEKRKNR